MNPDSANIRITHGNVFICCTFMGSNVSKAAGERVILTCNRLCCVFVLHSHSRSHHHLPNSHGSSPHHLRMNLPNSRHLQKPLWRKVEHCCFTHFYSLLHFLAVMSFHVVLVLHWFHLCGSSTIAVSVSIADVCIKYVIRYTCIDRVNLCF